MEAVSDLAGFALRLGGVKCFPDTSIVWLAVDGGAGLADLHARLLDRLPKALVREHYRSGRWTPHVTLQMQGNAVVAMRIAQARWPAIAEAPVVALELVQFPPAVVLRSVALT